jgi:hypothetical protein
VRPGLADGGVGGIERAVHGDDGGARKGHWRGPTDEEGGLGSGGMGIAVWWRCLGGVWLVW